MEVGVLERVAERPGTSRQLGPRLDLDRKRRDRSIVDGVVQEHREPAEGRHHSTDVSIPLERTGVRTTFGIRLYRRDDTVEDELKPRFARRPPLQGSPLPIEGDA